MSTVKIGTKVLTTWRKIQTTPMPNSFTNLPHGASKCHVQHVLSCRKFYKFHLILRTRHTWTRYRETCNKPIWRNIHPLNISSPDGANMTLHCKALYQVTFVMAFQVRNNFISQDKLLVSTNKYFIFCKCFHRDTFLKIWNKDWFSSVLSWETSQNDEGTEDDKTISVF